jgi:phosphatidylglycerophosphatase A
MKARVLLKHPLGVAALGFGSGLAPFAPGTFGSIAALVPAWWLVHDPRWLSLALLLIIPLGIAAGSYANRVLGGHDQGCIVIDEWAGQWLCLMPVVCLAPGLLASTQGKLMVFAVALLVFRLCDILKPWPVSWADRKLKGGFGVMADDLLAGAMAAMALSAIFLWTR